MKTKQANGTLYLFGLMLTGFGLPLVALWLSIRWRDGMGRTEAYLIDRAILFAQYGLAAAVVVAIIAAGVYVGNRLGGQR